eukprot:7328209-Prymnesium_polylepis.1
MCSVWPSLVTAFAPCGGQPVRFARAVELEACAAATAAATACDIGGAATACGISGALAAPAPLQATLVSSVAAHAAGAAPAGTTLGGQSRSATMRATRGGIGGAGSPIARATARGAWPPPPGASTVGGGHAPRA